MPQTLRHGAARRRAWGTFPTTADMGLWARGRDPAELFEALGLSLFAAMTDLRTVRPREERAVDASGTDPVALAVAYLQALLALADGDGYLARSIRVRTLGDPPTALLAAVRGEPRDPARHPGKVEIKAITWHAAQVDLARGRARLIVDI
ncbi:MAG: archease [Thermoplasmata archaeon]